MWTDLKHLVRRLPNTACASAGRLGGLALTLTLAASAPASVPASPTSQDGEKQPSGATVQVPLPDLVLDRGEDQLPLVVPSGERLVYDVVLDVAVIGRTRVGSLVLSSGVEPFRQGLPTPGQAVEASERRAGWVRANARGGYLGYSLEHTIESRLLPQEWPAVIVRNTQSGTENRRHELMHGVRKGEPTLWYRRNHHCSGCEREEHFVEGGLARRAPHHCAKCKRGEHRIWGKPALRPIPEGAVDMLTAIHLARSLVRSTEDSISMPLLDKDKWWDLTLSKGERQEIQVPAGSFACRAVKLTPNAPEGEEREERFKGLFGIHGSLSVWLDQTSGVPVQIEGLVPLGPLNLDVSVELREVSGVPLGFVHAK